MITTDEEIKKYVKEKLSDNEIGTYTETLLKIINVLLNEYSFVENQTYPRPSHPKKEKRGNSLQTLIAIIISLRTTLENEVKVTTEFFQKYKNIDDIIAADEEEMESIIKSAGMQKQKTKTIKNIARIIKEKYNGDLDNAKMLSIEQTRDELLKIPGLGPKSVDCLIELGFDMPNIAVDVNVFRVVSRITNKEWAKKPDFQNEKQVRNIKEFLNSNIEKDYLLCQIVHTLLLLHGKYICNSKTKCNKCVISDNCGYFEQEKEMQ